MKKKKKFISKLQKAMRPMRIQPLQHNGNGQYSEHMSYKQYNTCIVNNVIYIHMNLGVQFPQNQIQNSLLVKRQNDNTSPGDWPKKISP